MSGYIPNLVVVEGECVKLPIRKKPGETHAQRAGRVAAAALGRRCKAGDHFAVRYDRTWHIYKINFHLPIRSGWSEAAAFAWLMHKAHRDG